MSGANADGLNQARRVAQLSAVGCIAYGGSQQRWVKDQGLREAVAPEQSGCLAPDIGDLTVGVIAVHQSCPAARPVVGSVGGWEFLSDQGREKLLNGLSARINGVGQATVHPL